ncbi:hypothetical protein FJSC11DRAFT_1358 [Fischerella thermalis JSC-11]|jgi:hypothetical protein|uniref:Uncharacterized protein n=1 Tax=Fischerella thermalis JSC-11 TaxID=741277 RepID=G6FR61_9CYAN|nr:hypothetical protein FJSC11DRAFT_1358 [Fischerella thermalis JSC-11]
MPKVLAQDKTSECMRRANRQKILLQNGIDLYNSGAKVINCRLIGSCSVQLQAEGKASKANWREGQLSLPPHSPIKNLGFGLSNSAYGRCKSHQF